MAQIIEQQRIKTAIDYQDTIVQKNDIDRVVDIVVERVEELSRKPKEQLTDAEKGELRIAANFASKLVEISNNHEFGRQYVEYSQRIRNVLQQHFQGVQQVCAETQTLTGELKCEMPAVSGVPSLRGTLDEQEDAQNADILQQPEEIDQEFYREQLHGQIAQIKAMDTSLGDRLSTFFTSEKQDLFLAEVRKKIHTTEVSDADVVRITRESLITVARTDSTLFSSLVFVLQKSTDNDWKQIASRFDIRGNLLSHTVASGTTLENIKKQSQEILNTLQEGKIPKIMVQQIVDRLRESQNHPEQRHECIFLLSTMFSGFNHMGITINMKYDGTKRGILLKAPTGKAKSVSRATPQDVQEYQNIIDPIQSLLSPQDIQRIFLYRTTHTLHSYLTTTRLENRNTTHYVFHLLGTQGIKEIRANIGDEEEYSEVKKALQEMESQGNARSRTYLQTALRALSPEGFQSFLSTCEKCIKNRQTEKEYILVYFQDLYHNRERNTDNDEQNHINDYADFIQMKSPVIQQLLGQLEKLNAVQRSQLGLTSSNTTEHFKELMEQDPAAGLLYGVSQADWAGGIAFALVAGLLSKVGILGKLGKEQGGKIALLAGFTGGLWGTGLLGDGLDGVTSIVGSIFGGEDEEGSPTGVDLARIQERESFIYYDPQADKDTRAVWNELAQNERFWNAQASLLTFFQPGGTKPLEENQTEAQFFEKHFGIALTKENKGIYMNIFNDFLNEKKNIGAPLEKETMEAYRKRTEAPSNTPLRGSITGDTNLNAGTNATV